MASIAQQSVISNVTPLAVTLELIVCVVMTEKRINKHFGQ